MILHTAKSTCERGANGEGVDGSVLAKTGSGEGGAISLVGLFMIVFMVGVLYYVVGTAQAIFLRERLQDSTDAAAMTAAIVQAQAMNFVVLLNIAMSVILAVLIAIGMVQNMAFFGILVAGGLAWPTAGASLALIPPLQGLYTAMETARREVEPSVEETLRELHETADSITEFAPEAARSSAQATLTGSRLDLVGFASAPSSRLPIEDARYSTLCDHSGDVVADFATSPFTTAGIQLGIVDDFVPVSRIIKRITNQLAAWFCSEEGAAAPNREETVTVSYPDTGVGECSDSAMQVRDELAAGLDGDEAVATASCQDQEEARAAAKPDDSTGGCRPETDCSLSGPYERFASEARIQCNPAARHNLAATSYVWRKGTLPIIYTEDGWKRNGHPTLLRSGYSNEAQKKNGINYPPCGEWGRGNVVGAARVSDGEFRELHELSGSVARAYNSEAYPHGEGGEFVPVCSRTTWPLPSSFPFGHDPEIGDSATCEYEEVTYILGCTERHVTTLDFAGASQDGEGGEDQSPKQVIATVALGDEALQIWAVVERTHWSDTAARLVRLPLWRHGAPDNPLAGLRWLGRYGLAQAELYYAGSGGEDGREAWMWNMNWRARLRRFAWPTDEAHRQVLQQAASQSGLSKVSELQDALVELRDAIAH